MRSRQGRRRGGEGGQRGAASDNQQVQPWRVECSGMQPQKPTFAAADSPLEVGRAQAASFTLLKRNLSFFCRCSGLFQTPPGLGGGEGVSQQMPALSGPLSGPMRKQT